MAKQKHRAKTGSRTGSNRLSEPDDILRYAAAQLAEAEQLRRAGNMPRAKKLCEDLIKKFPDYVGALHTLGVVHYDMEKYDKAVITLAQANFICPGNWQVLVAYGRVLVQLGRLEAALDVLGEAQELAPDRPAILKTLVEIYRYQEKNAQAIGVLQKLLELDPGDEKSRNLIVGCHEQLGERDRAAALGNANIRDGIFSIGLIGTMSALPAELIVADLPSLLDKLDTPTGDDEISAHFTRATLHHQSGNWPEAWRELCLANELKSSTYATDWQLAADQRTAELGSLGEASQERLDSPLENAHPVSLFILGPPRSGKTSLEMLLGCNSTIFMGHENDLIKSAGRETLRRARYISSSLVEDIPGELHADFRSRYFEALGSKMDGARVFTNTQSDILSDVLACQKIVPNARFVFVDRDKDDLALRIFMKNFGSIDFDFTTHLQAIRDYINWYHGMGEAIAARMPEACCIIAYEDMIANPEATIKTISALCGIDPQLNDLPDIGDDRGVAAPYKAFMRDP